MSVGSLIKRSVQLIDDASEQWIGWTRPPASQIINQNDWHVDSRDAYCPRCGDSVGAGEVTESGCGTCRNEREYLFKGIADGMVRLGPYVNPLRRWILHIKFHEWNDLGEQLGCILGKQVRDAQVIDPHRTVIVPIPSPFTRRLLRQINHTHSIANGVAGELRAPIRSILGQRNRPLQTSLAPSVRKKSGGIGLHLRRSFRGESLKGSHVLLVDDIRTTGATLKAATRLLRELKPDRVVCAVLAVSDAKARRMRENEKNTAKSACIRSNVEYS